MKPTRKTFRAAASAMLCRAMIIGATLLPMFASSVASAAEDEDTNPLDGRLAGYKHLEPGGTALTWLLTAVLAVLCISVMFKSAKRTHLD